MQPPESQTELGANVFAFFVKKKTVIREILMTVLLFWEPKIFRSRFLDESRQHFDCLVDSERA